MTLRTGLELLPKRTLMMRDAQIHDQGDGAHTVCKIRQLDVSTGIRATCEEVTLAGVRASCSNVQSCAFLSPAGLADQASSQRCGRTPPGHECVPMHALRALRGALRGVFNRLNRLQSAFGRRLQ